ncbi:DnaT-like ssDNA-binding domain-containing protein [Pseudomonas sp. MF7453]|uniref:DnaT-like ssDNA-binding domain-containing protein n=1 Tax=Pseudomonas sp. MF7453 TaxID=2797539 RepID=UPI0018E78AD4|nr:DnaT-like ssDNA-binding domain-containing protein [Pseudomonas sp. MF7453]MBJ2216405.1 hypothetical protein [Pseudomonas sp. MF7453]
MARARNVKPGLFSNELLVELPAFDRLMFIGLWCLADREGRLEDRVKRIKIELLPCDDYDVDAGLNRLASAGFISRYQVAGQSVIEIVNFQKHQSPHGSEKDSTLPDVNGYLTVNERKKNVVVAGAQRKVHVSEHGFNVKPPLEPVNTPNDNALIPDCGFLIPDSLNQDQHHSLSAGEGNSDSAEQILENVPSPAVDPVDPKAPVEMTLDWVPDVNLLKTYCVHFGVSPDLFTHEAMASFTAHHESIGGLNTQAKWVSLLVGWVKSDRAKASNVRQLKPLQPSRHSGFAERNYTAGLTMREDGTYGI